MSRAPHPDPPEEHVPKVAKRATPTSISVPSHAWGDWGHLNHLQVGRYCEYFAKMAFALRGFEVFTSEVDDRGIDFIARRGSSPFYEVQVKSKRGNGYIFIPKSKAPLHSTRLLVAVVLRSAREPELYLLPMTAWKSPNALLVSRDYVGSKKSKPEWGLNVSTKNQALLDAFHFAHAIEAL
jgi:hypothetical protein